MAWDTEGTKRRIMQAATTEFAQHGPDGTTVERIARRAGVNKERVYNYFRGKRTLFTTVCQKSLHIIDAKRILIDSCRKGLS